MSLEVLIVESDGPVTEALSSTLERRGHRVSTARSAERALALPASDVIVCEAKLPGSCGFDLLSAVKRRGDDARFVILLGDPTVEECLRALRLGANDVLRKPFRLDDLVRAVEGSGDATSGPQRTPSGEFDCAYPATGASVERCARELSAFALVHAVPPSVRARIAGAAEELVDNAVRHARLADGSEIRVRARLEGATFHLRIRDAGVGFDGMAGLLDSEAGPARTGIARARALSESLTLRSDPGAGTRVDLRFTTSGADLSGTGRDLSELDFLTPHEAENLISSLLDGKTPDIEALSPALAVVLGRLLAGSEPIALASDPAEVRPDGTGPWMNTLP